MEKENVVKQLNDMRIYCLDSAEMTGDSDWLNFADALETVVDAFSTEVSGDDAQSIIRTIMENDKVNQTKLANDAGMVRQNLSQMLNRGKSIRYASFQKIIDALGYEIVARKKRN